MEKRPFEIDILRSMKMAVVKRSVNSQVSPMLLINVLKLFHSNSSIFGSGSVSHIPNPSLMNRQRKERWRGGFDNMCFASKIAT
jgi:hypothetical protein